MHISNLHIFDRDTDANEQLLGYKFQELKTLETWLRNKVNGIDEEIYCEVEEDILQRDFEGQSATFRQVKLYSSKAFSFTSVEIKKALFNFLMHFANKDFLFDEVVFSFETNTSLAREYAENSAKLLGEWIENQGTLSDDLMNRCIEKVKEITGDYISKRYEALILKDETKEEAETAKRTFDELPQEIWRNFVKAIRWEFTEETSENSVIQVKENIERLIGELAFPISQEQSDNIFARLQQEVGNRSVGADPKERCLTNRLMDGILLSMGGKEDNWYLETLERWESIDTKIKFTVGLFYQVKHAARHCRQSGYLEEHGDIWLKQLSGFINSDDILPKCRREGIYEFIWVTLMPRIEIETTSASLNNVNGLEDLLREYFVDLELYTDHLAIEDCLNLLTLIASHQQMGFNELKK